MTLVCYKKEDNVQYVENIKFLIRMILSFKNKYEDNYLNVIN